MTQDDLLSDLPTVGGGGALLRPGAALGPGGRFLLAEAAGRGGMGVVWRATDQRLGRAVALKFLPEILAGDRLARQQIEHEAAVMLDLTHPGIVRLLTLEEEQGLLFLVMELLDGPTLREVLADRVQSGRRGLAPDEARWLLAGAAPALDHAHRLGVLHRDLKPANLMLTKPAGDPLGDGGEEVKVTDFGIAYVASTSFTQLTGRSHTSGTLPYMAPEVLLGRPPSAASDVYALGVTLYELVAGHLPFTHGDLSRQITDASPPPLESGDAVLDAAVAAALAKDPGERPASAGELLAVAGAAGARARTRERTRERRGSGRRPLAWLAGAVLIAAAGWAGWWKLTGPAAGEPPAAPVVEHAVPAAAPPPAPPAEAVAPAALSEPLANTLTNADYVPVRGTGAASAGSAVWLQIEGKPESRKKVSVGRDGQFELAVFRLPQTDGSYFLEILAEDETLLLQSPLRVDRTPPALVGSPRFSPDGPFRSGDGIAADLEFSERVVPAGGSPAAPLSTSLHWTAVAPPSAAADPEEIPLTLQVVDEAGNAARIEVAVLVFDPDRHVAKVRDRRPDLLTDWRELDPPARGRSMAEWKDAVAADPLLAADEQEALLAARPPVVVAQPRPRESGPFRAGEEFACVVEVDQPVAVLAADGTVVAELEGGTGVVDLAAPLTEAADPESATLSFRVRDPEGDEAACEIELQIYDPRARLARHAAARPDRSPDWSALDKEARPGAVEAWMSRVREDALLTESERRALLDDDGSFQRLREVVAREAREAAAKLNPFGWEVLDATPGPKTGAARKLKDPQTGIVFILVEPGEFLMGSPTSEPERDSDETQHRVTLTKAFYLGETEVTQAQWQRVMGSNPSHFKGDTLPVETVSWEDCQDFCRKAGEGYRLPAEAEWEYACRAGTTTPFSFGSTISTEQANYDGNYVYGNGRKGIYRQKTTPVASFPGNAWGFKDMHGNVWEWCQDRYGEYPSGSVVDPKGATSGSCVLRGGSCYLFPRYCRSANRFWNDPSAQGDYLGLRVARTL